MILKKNENNTSNVSFSSTNLNSMKTNKIDKYNQVITNHQGNNEKMFYSKIPINSMQSPKVNSIQKRSSSQPKLFSLIDLNEKITNKRGTDLPDQYKRRSQEEIKELLNQTSQQLMFQNKLYKNISNFSKYSKKNHLQKNVNNTTINRGSKITANNIKNNDNTVTYEEVEQCTDNIISKKSNRSIQTAVPGTRNTRLYKPYIMDKEEYLQFKDKVPNDKWKPKDYDFFDSMVKKAPKEVMRSKSSNPRDKSSNIIQNNSLPLLTKEQIRQKCYDSDIFFTRPESSNNYQQKIALIPNYQNSDIFHIKNDALSISKSGEKSYFKPKPEYKYTALRESNSQWNPKNLMPTLLNHSSSEHHILNPGIKNISSTKKQLEDKCKKITSNYGLAHRQKSLCEFIDVSRVSAPHQNKDYLDMLSKDKNVFGKRNDICSDYYDIFGCYKNLCDKPFVKFKIIQGEL